MTYGMRDHWLACQQGQQAMFLGNEAANPAAWLAEQTAEAIDREVL